jgi:sugar lactone lactonase YvrE
VSGALSLQLRTFLPDGTPTPPVINGGFGTNALALDALGRLFMLLPGEDRNNGFIRVFTPEMKQAMPPIVTHLSLADGIALDPSGKIYVISQGDNVIKTYDASGKQTEPTIREGMKGPRAIAVGPDGKIYAANFTTVTTYYPDGERTPQTITHINREGGGPDSPMSLALDAKGRLYIGYHSGLVWIINPDGKSAGEGFMARRFIQGIALR